MGVAVPRAGDPVAERPAALRHGSEGRAAGLDIAAAAARTGLTPRALRHYEALGLVHPTARRSGFFRLYSERDVRRVARIAALRRLLGLTLAQVGQLLDAEDLSEAGQSAPAPERAAAAAVIERHVSTLRERAEHLERLKQRYEKLIAGPAGVAEVSAPTRRPPGAAAPVRAPRSAAPTPPAGSEGRR